MEKSEFSHEGMTENKKFRKKMLFRFERKLDIPAKNLLGNLGFWENTYNIAEHNPQNLGLRQPFWFTFASKLQSFSQ